MIEEKVKTINSILGSKGNTPVGKYEYDASLNSHKLVRITSKGRSQTNILFGSTKRELFDLMDAFLIGIREYMFTKEEEL